MNTDGDASPRGQLQHLSDRIIADLFAASDYYEHTVVAWRLVQRLAEEGRVANVTNLVSGSVVGAEELADLGNGYVRSYLAESVFQHCVSLFEDFTFGLIGIWLLAYPRGIARGDARDRSEKTVPWRSSWKLPTKSPSSGPLSRENLTESNTFGSMVGSRT